MEYTSIETIIANINNTLHSFADANLIDESDIMRHAEFIIKKLDIALMTNHELILPVENCKADLPKNFSYLEFISRCTPCDGKNRVKKRYTTQHPTIKYVQKDFMLCNFDNCKIRPQETYITSTFYWEGEECLEESYTLSPILNKVKRVTSNSPRHYSKSPNDFAIEGDYIYFNFEEGDVFISYWGFDVDENGYYKILDDTVFIKAIETYVIYQILLTIYYNSESDVQQRMQFAEKEYRLAFQDAQSYSKLPQFYEYIRKAKRYKRDLRIFNLPSNADYRASTRNTTRC